MTALRTDTAIHKGKRRRLIEHLRQLDIADDKVLEAMANIPRHWFIHDTALIPKVYSDIALHIGAGQTISQPSTVALQTTLLDLEAGVKVLEIGTGSGYQAAVLAELGIELHTIERQSSLFGATQQLLNQVLGYSNVHCYLRDGFEGVPEEALFDRILITAAAPSMPEVLFDQLKVGGTMVVPITQSNGDQLMMRYRKWGETPDKVFVDKAGKCAFVPMLPGINP